MTPTPIRSISLATPSITATPLSGGGVTLQSNDPLGDYETQLGELLRHWADARPDTVFLGERTADAAWRTVTYGETRTACDAISQSLLDRGLGPERPVMLLSGNAIDHGLLSFAAMQVGIPIAPVSPAYSLMSTDFAKVKLIKESMFVNEIFVIGVPAKLNVFKLGTDPDRLVIGQPLKESEYNES